MMESLRESEFEASAFRMFFPVTSSVQNTRDSSWDVLRELSNDSEFSFFVVSFPQTQAQTFLTFDDMYDTLLTERLKGSTFSTIACCFDREFDI